MLPPRDRRLPIAHFGDHCRIRVTRRQLPALGAAALALACAGCGNRSDPPKVRAVATAFYEAVQRHDGAAACRLLSQDTRQALVENEGEACAKAVVSLKLQGGRPGAASVFETNADVQLVGGDRVFLSREQHAWRISAAGCKPQGPVSKQPYDCELQD